MPQILVVLCCMLLVTGGALASPRWSGYINDLSNPVEQYGYLEVASEKRMAHGFSKLRLTCYRPQGFRLYIDERGLEDMAPSQVSVAVDALPAIDFQLYQHGSLFFLSDQSRSFWELVAQMVAGRSISLRPANAPSSQYSLSGFTRKFNSNCGWMPAADSYRDYVGKYR